MAIYHCKECGGKISTRYEGDACPHCGYPMTHVNQGVESVQVNAKHRKYKLPIILGAVVTIVILAVGCWYFGLFDNDVNNIKRPYQGKPYEELTQLADKNDLEAITEIGRIYAENDDWQTALNWFMRAANQGYTVAENNVGACYENMEDFNNAVLWWEKAANKGFVHSMNNLALRYFLQGKWEKGVEWAKKSADYGDTYGLYLMGEYYNYSDNSDADKAIEYYTKAMNSKDITNHDKAAINEKVDIILDMGTEIAAVDVDSIP